MGGRDIRNGCWAKSIVGLFFQRCRVKSALRTRSCLIPPLYGLPKDHKDVPPDQEHLGPPLRPVCGATESANGALSELLTEILTKVGDESDKESFNCLSNEELMAALSEVNKKDMKEPIIFSMDVVSMFPNLNVERVLISSHKIHIK